MSERNKGVQIFLRLIETGKENDEVKSQLINEAVELEKIFGAIIRNSSD